MLEAIHVQLNALYAVQSFPLWMWRNTTVLLFLDWLRQYNLALPKTHQRLQGVGFYGLDIHSLNKSSTIVINYLEKIDAEAAAAARHHYSCFDRHLIALLCGINACSFFVHLIITACPLSRASIAPQIQAVVVPDGTV